MENSYGRRGCPEALWEGVYLHESEQGEPSQNNAVGGIDSLSQGGAKTRTEFRSE